MLKSLSRKISNKILATLKFYHSLPLKLQEYFVLYIALNFGSHFFNHNDDFLIKFFTEILISAQLYIVISNDMFVLFITYHFCLIVTEQPILMQVLP